MIRTDYYGHKWFTDEYDDEAEPYDLTDAFGKGNEPKTDAEARKMIKECFAMMEGR